MTLCIRARLRWCVLVNRPSFPSADILLLLRTRLQLKAVDVLPVGTTIPMHLEIKDPNVEERSVYWQQQMDKRAAGEIELTVGMELEDEEDQYAKRRGVLLNDGALTFDPTAVAVVGEETICHR